MFVFLGVVRIGRCFAVSSPCIETETDIVVQCLFGTPRGRPRKDAQPDRSWKGTQREAPAVKEKTARSLAWKVVYREVASTNSRVGELINK